MSVEFNKSLKIFSQLFVGIRAQGRSESPPLAFATPYEVNAAGRKRQETVENWLGGKRSGTRKLLDNVPREGFRITDNIKRVYWGGGNVVFRVLDPDGWEVEIQSANLMTLISEVGIQKEGIVPGKCVWARDGAINVLLHETSEEYKTAIQAAETVKPPKEVVASDRTVGKEYQLLNGSTAFYLGKFWVTGYRYKEHQEMHAPLFGKEVPTGRTVDQLEVPVRFNGRVMRGRMFTQVLQAPEQHDAVFLPDAHSIVFYKKAPLISETGAKLKRSVESVISDPKKSFSYASSSRKDEIIHVSSEKPKNLRYRVRDLTQEEFDLQLKNMFGRPTESAAARGFFYNSNYIVGLKSNGQYFANHFNVYSMKNGYHSEEHGLGRLFVREKEVDNYIATYDGYPAGQSNVVETYYAPHSEALSWCRLQYAAGNLFRLIVEEDVGND